MRHLVPLVLFLAILSTPVSAQSEQPDWTRLDPRGAKQPPKTPAVGMVAPSLDVTGWLNAPPMRLEDMSGSFVFLDFWSIHCRPCVRALPRLEALQKSLPENVHIVTIHPDTLVRSPFLRLGTARAEEILPRFLREKDFDLPVALDNGGETSRRYSIRVNPTYVLIGPDGRVRWSSFLLPSEDQLRAFTSDALTHD